MDVATRRQDRGGSLGGHRADPAAGALGEPPDAALRPVGRPGHCHRRVLRVAQRTRRGGIPACILTSAAWGVGSLLSVVVRWPIVGFIVAAGDPLLAEDPTAWRRDGGLVRVCQKLTMVLVLLYAVRVAVMFPLYLAGQVTLLGVAKIALGWPAY